MRTDVRDPARMSPRSLLLVAAVLWVVLWHPATTAALLEDRERSNENAVAGGTLDVALSEVGAGTEDSTLDETDDDTLDETWKDLSHEPTLGASDAVDNTVRIDNGRSSLAASRVNVTVSYTEDDGLLGIDGNADGTARTLVIDSLEYGNTELVGTEVVDENGNGHVDLEDLTLGTTAANLSDLDGIAVDGTVDLRLVVDGSRQLLDGVGAEDGVDITVTVRAESPTFVDTDRSTGNTIRYATL